MDPRPAEPRGYAPHVEGGAIGPSLELAGRLVS